MHALRQIKSTSSFIKAFLIAKIRHIYAACVKLLPQVLSDEVQTTRAKLQVYICAAAGHLVILAPCVTHST